MSDGPVFVATVGSTGTATQRATCRLRAWPGASQVPDRRRAPSPNATLDVSARGRPGGTPGVTAAVDGPQATLVLLAYLPMFMAASAVLMHRHVA